MFACNITVRTAVLTGQHPLHCHLSHLSSLEVQMHFLLQVQLTDVNNDYFCKKGPKIFAYITCTLRFSFFIPCEKKVFISDRLEAKTKIALT